MGEPGSSEIQHASHVETRERREEISHPQRIEQIRGFSNVLGEYKTSLNAIVDSPHLPEDITRNMDAIRSDTQGDHAQDVKAIFHWYTENFGGASKLLHEAVSEEKLVELQQVVATNLAEFLSAARRPDRSGRKPELNRQMTTMAQFLLADHERFGEVQAVLEKEELSLEQPTWEGTEDLLEVLHMVALADREISLLHPDTLEASVKGWVAQMASEARSGVHTPEGSTTKRKIYETPHYLQLLDTLKHMGRRKNGVGGVILYGPPGTGKTELVKEKNRREGFETKVINIHHYIGYSELFGEAKVGVQADAGAPLAAKLNTVILHAKRMDGASFGQSMQAIYEELRSQDKAGETIGEFLLPHVTTDDAITHILIKDTMDDADWETIRQAFLKKQETRVLRTALTANQQEIPEEVIRGEILLALKRGRETGQPVRVLLDEVDKAGPGSLGGLLSFLSQSPGETFDMRGVPEEIPSWFKVDATSNAPIGTLRADFVDRFDGLHVDAPPAKDLLMITATRLSDTEGNIQLNGYEQEQLAAFFVHAIPEVNDLLIANNRPPISIRSIGRFTNNLMDFDNMQRTSMSMGRALRALVVDPKIESSAPELVGQLEQVLAKYSLAATDKTREQGRRARFQRPAAEPQAEEVITPTTTVDSQPLLKVIAGLKDDAPSDKDIVTEEIILSPEQQQTIADEFQRQQSVPQRDDLRVLPTGQMLRATNSDQGLQVGIVNVRPGEPAHTVVHNRVPTTGRLTGASADGKVVILASQREAGQTVTVLRSIMADGSEISTLDTKTNEHVEVDPTGRTVGCLSSEGILTMYSLKNGKPTEIGKLPGVDRYEFAPDGRTILVTPREGETTLLYADSFRRAINPPLDEQEGFRWTFVGEHILAQVSENQTAVAESARYVA